MAKKLVMAELRADVTGLRSDLNGAARMFEQLNSKIERMQTSQVARGRASARGGQFNASGEMQSRFGGAMQTATAVAAGGAFYGMAAEMKSIRDYEKALVDLAVSGGESGAYLARMRTSVKQVSDTYGIAKEDVLGFAQEIVTATGDTKLAESQLASMGKVAYASGADMKDLAGVMVNLQNVAQIPIGEAEGAFGILIEQAQKGSFELKDMARLLPGVINYMGAFGKTGAKSMGEVAALLQVAKRAVPSSEEAAVATMRMFDAINNKRENIEKTLGIKLKDDKGKYKDIGVMMQLIAGGIASKEGQKVGKGSKSMDVEGWAQSTFDVRGSKIMRLLVNQAKAGWDTKIGNYETYSTLAGSSGQGAVQKMYESRKSLSGTGEWSKAMNEFRNHMHQTLLPVVKKLAEWMPSLAAAGKTAADNFGLLISIIGSVKLLGLVRAWSTAGASAAATSRAAAVSTAATATASASVASRMALAGMNLLTTGLIVYALFKERKAIVEGVKKVGNKIGDQIYDDLNSTEAVDLAEIKAAEPQRRRGMAIKQASGFVFTLPVARARKKLQAAHDARRFLLNSDILGGMAGSEGMRQVQAGVESAEKGVSDALFSSMGEKRGKFVRKHLTANDMESFFPEMSKISRAGGDAMRMSYELRALAAQEKVGKGVDTMVGLLGDFIKKNSPQGKTGKVVK
jgi:TP901 family phage tail tape measure protein